MENLRSFNISKLQRTMKDYIYNSRKNIDSKIKLICSYLNSMKQENELAISKSK